MKRLWIMTVLCLCTALAFAQGTVKGKVLEKSTDSPLGFVNVVVKKQGEDKIFKGVITDESGSFTITGLPKGNYVLSATFVGMKELTRPFAITDGHTEQSYNALYMSDDARQLKEVVVTGQRSGMKLEVDRKSFDVSQEISNAGGSADEVLANIPSVEVDNDGNVSLRGNSSVEVWINGKASGMTGDNRAMVLQQLPAESIERVEVIDNPSAKFSAEGSAGIINIILKKNRKAGYFGSVNAGANTNGGANVGTAINYSSPAIDANLNVAYRHRERKGGSSSFQQNFLTNEYQRYNSTDVNMGNNVFAQGGFTWHPDKKNEFSLAGMMMTGRRNEFGLTPYYYGILGTDTDTKMLTRKTRGGGDMNMWHGELGYKHSFTDKQFIDFSLEYNSWNSDNDSYYRDSTTYFGADAPATTYAYQYRPMNIRNHSWAVRLDYEQPLGNKGKLQAGYQGDFSRENTPQESWIDNYSWNGEQAVEDKAFFNRFIYNLDIHALYATATYNIGKLGIMAGLRGEYWRVKTDSYDWEQEHDASKRAEPYKTDNFQLFPSLFLSYQLTESQQLQLNYTRRLRRPWGGELNSFRDTRDATNIRFGNPELTPEYSNSFSLNYLKTWPQHSLLVSAYYRPTTNVIQRVRWQDKTDGMMYQTNLNVTKSQSTGLEVVLKNKLWKILDLTTTFNAYHYHLDGFTHNINGQTVTGDSDNNFTWNARTRASLILPYDITFQATASYTAKQVITQGYREPGYSVDLGVRKNFFDKKFTAALNVRDLLDSQKRKIHTGNDTFDRYMERWGGGRRVSLTLTWNFGNMKQKKKPANNQRQNDEDTDPNGGYGTDINY